MPMPTTAAIPATYCGSLPEFHGPVLVEIDAIGTAVHGDLRFYVWTPDGEFLHNARVGSLSFSAPLPAPRVIAVQAREVSPPKALQPYCQAHDIYDCPFDGI